jgi:hypothetical protein
MGELLKAWLASLQKPQTDEPGIRHPDGLNSTELGAGQHDISSSDARRQEWKEALPLEFGDDMRLLLSPEYIQIDSPQRLDESFLKLFRMGYKKALLLNPLNGEIASGSLDDVQSDYLIANTATSTAFQQCGNSLLVVFPFLPKRQFVVQTVVDEIDGSKIRLRYQDPRCGIRWTLASAQEISLHIATAELTLFFAKQQVRSVREMTLSCDPSGNGQNLHIIDIPQVADSSAHLNAIQCFHSDPAIVCDLVNISLGGAGLSGHGICNRDELLHQLIRLDIPLRPLALGRASLQLRLQPFAVVHGFHAMGQSYQLNVQFLKQLPQELTAFFELLSAVN